MENTTATVSRRRVLLVTEGTYPFYWGGLSTWCDCLVTELPELDFSVLAVAEAPGLPLRFDLPKNVVEFRPTPLWGVRSAWEIDESRGVREVLRRRRRTKEEAIARDFLPSYCTFLTQILGEGRDDKALVEALHGIYTFFLDYDFDRTLRSRLVWSAVAQLLHEIFHVIAREHDLDRSAPSAGEVAAATQWVYHWLFPLAKPLPKVDVAHATMAGICSLVCLVAKAEHGSAFLLSEHGIYLREAYLSEHAGRGSLFLKLLKVGFARRMTELAYAKADAVAPCCDYNHRWEKRIGAAPERIRTAYYGIDPEAFKPAARERASDAAPVVAWAGRIDPLKDIETLLRAAALVVTNRPDVRFRLYGSAPPGNESYLERCMVLHTRLGLRDAVTFEGYAESTPTAFAGADLVVLSSISEGFPYSTLEAMLCGKPIVATGVGGIREQVSPACGRIVRPRDPQALGEAILEIVNDMEACDVLARAARERAASLFTVERFRATHRALYAGAQAGELPEPDLVENGTQRYTSRKTPSNSHRAAVVSR